jgi:hypothetical protein
MASHLDMVCQMCPARLYTKNPPCRECSKAAAYDRPKSSDPSYMDHYHCTTMPNLLKYRRET